MMEYATPLYCWMPEKPLITQVMTMAPTMAPHTEPDPPISIMTMGMIAAVNVKAPGVTAVVTNA